MNLAGWAERNGVARVAAYRWFHAGLLPVPARKVGRLILVDGPIGDAGLRGRTAVYARVSSADQNADLDRQVARVTAWATSEQMPVDKVVTEVGSALNGHRRKFLAVLRDPSVQRIVVEHRDRFCRLGSEYVQVALAARDESWSWWIRLRLITTWWGIRPRSNGVVAGMLEGGLCRRNPRRGGRLLELAAVPVG